MCAFFVCTTEIFAAPSAKAGAKALPEEGYTINFDNVSIKEFLKFVSRIGNVNVIYNDADLNFNVTIVSEDKTDLNNVMSALVQILRIHGLTLIEEEKNLIIHSNTDVRQIPTVVSDEVPLTGKNRPAIMTKVFKISKGNPAHIASLLTPMLSRDALVEVSMSTMQLIITDVASSIDTIEELLMSLDAPQTPYDVEAYISKNISVIELGTLAKKILDPIIDNTTLELIPQIDTGTLYIVSTPFLIDKTLAVLRELDKESILNEPKNLSAENVLIYKLQHKNAEEILASLKKIAEEANSQGFTSTGLGTVLLNAKFIKSTRSLMFIGPPATLSVVDALLKNVDAVTMTTLEVENSSFYFFEPQGISLEDTIKVLKEISANLKKNEYSRPGLIHTIDSARPILPLETILFTGSPETIMELKPLLTSVQDSVLSLEKVDGPYKFFIYNIKDANEEQIRSSLNNLADYLDSNHYPNTELIKAIRTMKWIKATNSLIFTGHQLALKELTEIISSFDVPKYRSQAVPTQTPLSTDFVLFSPKNMSIDGFKEAIEEMAKNLKAADLADPAFLKTLETVKSLPSSDQLIFTGDSPSLKRLSVVLAEIDQQDATLKEGPYLVQVGKADYQKIKNALDLLVAGLPKSDPLAEIVKGMKYLPDANVIVFRGSPIAMQKITEVIELTNTAENERRLGSTVVFVSLQQADVKAVVKMLQEMGLRLESTKGSSPGLIATLKGAQASGNSVILTGSPENVAQAKELINAEEKTLASEKNVTPPHTAFVPIQKSEGKMVIKMLHETAAKLENIEGSSPDLIATLAGAQLTVNENMIILSGKPETIAKAQELISADAASIPQGALTEVWLYRLKNLSAKDLNAALMGVAHHADDQNPSALTRSLITTIETMREIPDSKAVQFVATDKTIQKLKELIEILDVQTTSNIKTTDLGSNFLVYKVKHINPQDLLNHLKQLIKDEGNPSQETSITKTIKNARYVKESHSLIFTGSKGDLGKIETFLNDLDVSQNPPQVSADRHVEGYKLYRPSYVSGLELIQMVKNFEEHLVASGGSNESLSEVIDHLSYINRTNAIIVTGEDKSVDEVMNLFKEFDTSDAAAGDNGPYNDSNIETIDDTGFLIYKLQHQTGEGIVNALTLVSSDLANMKNQKKNESLIESIRSVQWIEITNSLIATGEPKVLTKLKELIESIDRPLKQVFIEILMIEVSDTTTVDIGLSWGSFGANQNRIGWGLGNYPASNTGSNASTFSQQFPTINGTNVPSGGPDIPPINSGFLGVIGDLVWANGKSYASLGSLLTALKNDGDTTVVLSQKIVTQDNQNAKIFSGSNVPFTGSLVTTSGLSQTTNANLEYRNIGVTLSITPIIGDNGLITMDIDLENSEEANQGSGQSSSVSTNSVNGITTSRTSMQTRVHMPDRHFLVLSGTMRNQITRLVSGIPCLGGLPMIGAAFSETSKLTVNTNVIVFVKPHVITSPEVYESITRNQQEIYGNPKQANVRDYNSALELIRSPDDEEYDEED